MENILSELESILRDTSDYLSHESAIFLHGFLEQMPERIIVVTDSRRRNRTLGNYRLDFIFHKEDKPRETQIFHDDGRQIRIASISQALTDLLTDNHDLSLETVADFFSRIPCNTENLLKLAHKTANASFKRALFWCLWAGRLKYSDLPAKLDRTPVKIFPAEKDDDVWEGSIQVFYPAKILSVKPCIVPAGLPPELLDWQKIRQSTEVLEVSQREKWLPIAQDVREKQKKLLDQCFSLQIKSYILNDFSNFLIRFHAPDEDCRLPVQFVDWVKKESAFADQFKKEIKSWCREQLDIGNTRLLDIAFQYANDKPLIEAALKKAAENPAAIYNSGLSQGLEKLYKMAAHAEIKVPRSVQVLLARIMARQNRFEEAFAIAEAAMHELSDPGEITEVYYATGIIYRQAGKLNEAVEHLKIAAETAQKAGLSSKTPAILCAIGNIYLVKSDLSLARKNYLKAFSSWKGDDCAPLISNIQTNLGLVEFRCGNLKKSQKFFKLAANGFDRSGNLQGKITTATMLARIDIALGNLFPALEKLHLVEKIQSEYSNDAEKREIFSLLSLAYEMAGQPVSSDQYWSRSLECPDAKITSAAEFHIFFINGIIKLLRGEFEAAESLFSGICEFGRKEKLSFQDISIAEFYLALSLHLQNKGQAKPIFLRLAENFPKSQEHPFQLFIKTWVAFNYPDLSDPSDISGLLNRLNASEYYEPAWFFLAEKLNALGSKPTFEFVKIHFEKSTPEFILLLEQRFPFCRKLFNRLHGKGKGKNSFQLIESSKSSFISENQYQALLNSPGSGKLLFDASSGNLSFSGRNSSLKQGSILCRILTSLFSAFPEPLSIETLYETVWGGNYDKEMDKASVKAAILRLRRFLQKVCPSAQIKAFGKENNVQLCLNVPFAAII
ncbi:MAG: type IV toxin-antitoxin system AbiEi family antitoxin [Candidatus Rifleibacteriota bacterium]